MLCARCRCKTTPTLEESHLLWYLERNHPVTICVSESLSVLRSDSPRLTFAMCTLCCILQTDDTLPFRTSLMAEYALLVADAPLGLGMKEEDVRRIAAWGVEGRFAGW
jgi:adenosine deaminase